MFMLKKVMVPVLTLLGCALACFADGDPLVMTTTGATLAGYVATAAAAGLGVFAALFGVRIIVRAFSSVAG